MSDLNKIGKDEAFMDYICALVDQCIICTGHGEYSPRIRFSSECADDDTDKVVTAASININSVYLYFSVMVYPPCYDDYLAKDYQSVARDIMHEIVHLLVDPLWYEMAVDAKPSQMAPLRAIMERQTQRITNALFNALPKHWYSPGKLLKKKEEKKVA